MPTIKGPIKFEKGKPVPTEVLEAVKKVMGATTIPAKKYTSKELYALNRKEQIELIRKLGYDGKIPRTEKERVALILKLQRKR